MSNHILVVEDEPALVDPLVVFLESQGFRCEAVNTGADALTRLQDGHQPDVVLLDLMLPDLSGLEVCRKLRADPHTADIPVIMVTARSDEYDKVVGFEVGADDYITKPYSLRELSLRISALLRRVRPIGGGVTASEDDLVFAEIELDRSAHKVSVAGHAIEVSVVEFRMLATFLDNLGRALTREEICVGTWGADYAISERAVDTNVKRLRQKLGDGGRYLETVRGIGYRWVSDPTEVQR